MKKYLPRNNILPSLEYALAMCFRGVKAAKQILPHKKSAIKREINVIINR